MFSAKIKTPVGERWIDWHTGEKFALKLDDLHLVEKVVIDGDELNYFTDQNIHIEGGKGSSNRVKIVYGSQAIALSQLLIAQTTENKRPHMTEVGIITMFKGLQNPYLN